MFGLGCSLTAAFERSVEAAAHLTDEHQALVAAGWQIANRIDAETEGNERAVKVLYLVPHLVNIMRELCLTPLVQREQGKWVPAGGEPETADELETARRRRRGV